MDPQAQNQGSFEMPPQQSNANMIPTVARAEHQASAPETMPAIGAPIPTSTTSGASAPVGPPIFQPSTIPAPPQTPIATPAVADDLDLIEKEWVEKAKAIVAQTRSDPYNQNKEMNRFKADYMQKRYGKEIKLDEK